MDASTVEMAASAWKPECITCRGTSDDVLCYFGLAQRSRMMRMGSSTLPQNLPVHLNMCGHAIHSQCFDAYYASQLADDNLSGSEHLTLDHSLGEYVCPMCKAVSNITIPFQPRSPNNDSSFASADAVTGVVAVASFDTDDVPGATAAADGAGSGGSLVATMPAAEDVIMQAASPSTDLMHDSAAADGAGSDGSLVAPAAEDIIMQAASPSMDLMHDSEPEDGASVSPAADKMHSGSESTSTDVAAKDECELSEGVAAVLASQGASMMSVPSVAWKGATDLMVDRLTDIVNAKAGYQRPASMSKYIVWETIAYTARCESLCHGLSLVCSRNCESGVGGAGGAGSARGTANDSHNDPISWLKIAMVGSCDVFSAEFVASQLPKLMNSNTLDPAWGPHSLLGQDPLAALAVVLAVLQPDESAAVLFVKELCPSIVIHSLLGMSRAKYATDTQSPTGESWLERLASVFNCPKTEATYERVRTELFAFLSAAVLLLCAQYDHPPSGVSPDMSLDPLLRVFGISSFESHTGGIMNPDRFAKITVQLQQLLRPNGEQLQPHVDTISPCITKELIDLPPDYADLHTTLTAKVPAKEAALCLICGDILACGKSTCTAHARDCGAGIGVVFILEKSSVLLIRGDGACYFPAPYVDAFGEPFRKHHGTPLKLDQRRYDVVKKMWKQHKVANEVIRTRASSERVIRVRWY